MIRRTLWKFLKNNKGAALVEYGLLIAGVALICAAAVSIFGHKTSDIIGTVAAVLPGAHTDDNNPMLSGHLIETTDLGGGGQRHRNRHRLRHDRFGRHRYESPGPQCRWRRRFGQRSRWADRRSPLNAIRRRASGLPARSPLLESTLRTVVFRFSGPRLRFCWLPLPSTSGSARFRMRYRCVCSLSPSFPQVSICTASVGWISFGAWRPALPPG